MHLGELLPAASAPKANKALVLLVLLVAIVGSCGLLGDTFTILGCSNYPALKPGNRISVDEPPGSIQRGDFIAFHPPSVEGLTAPKYAIMRVVGLPGDEIATVNGEVTINGRVLPEPYLTSGTSTLSLTPQTVPLGKYFVLGDNRFESMDSRTYGPVPAGTIIARMTGVYSNQVDTSAAADCVGAGA